MSTAKVGREWRWGGSNSPLLLPASPHHLDMVHQLLRGSPLSGLGSHTKHASIRGPSFAQSRCQVPIKVAHPPGSAFGWGDIGGEASSRASPEDEGERKNLGARWGLGRAWLWWQGLSEAPPQMKGSKFGEGWLEGQDAAFPVTVKVPMAITLGFPPPFHPPPSHPKEGQTNLGAKWGPGSASACCALRAARKELRKLSAIRDIARSGAWETEPTLETQPSCAGRATRTLL